MIARDKNLKSFERTVFVKMISDVLNILLCTITKSGVQRIRSFVGQFFCYFNRLNENAELLNVTQTRNHFFLPKDVVEKKTYIPTIGVFI